MFDLKTQGQIFWDKLSTDVATELGKTTDEMRRGQLECLFEECGEFAGAWRRWSGAARRPGTELEAQDELADIFIAAAVMAAAVGWDLDAILARKCGVVAERKWVDPRPGNEVRRD